MKDNKENKNQQSDLTNTNKSDKSDTSNSLKKDVVAGKPGANTYTPQGRTDNEQDQEQKNK